MTKTPANTSVTVGMYLASRSGLPDEFRGDYINRGKIWYRRIRVSVDITYGTVASAIDELTKASNGLIEARLDIEEVYNYGDSSIGAFVRGERPATAGEIVWVKKEPHAQEWVRILCLT